MMWAIGGLVIVWLITRKSDEPSGEMVVADWDDDPGVEVDE